LFGAKEFCYKLAVKDMPAVAPAESGGLLHEKAATMNRNRIRQTWALAVVFFALIAGTAKADPLDADTMKVALHTATPQEDGFIDYVLARVKAGKLPLDLVESTFLWAKKKPRNKFQYFKSGLIRRAEERGIHL
jgi:hypothetical protein